mmetsp:Transcript_25910/g.97595  ORF Transcript_25910/g.97595 Transcript_25910/m.97595 type:complete len:363 (-) Transcript_25910:1187-2275(-)
MPSDGPQLGAAGANATEGGCLARPAPVGRAAADAVLLVTIAAAVSRLLAHCKLGTGTGLLRQPPRCLGANVSPRVGRSSQLLRELGSRHKHAGRLRGAVQLSLDPQGHALRRAPGPRVELHEECGREHVCRVIVHPTVQQSARERPQLRGAVPPNAAPCVGGHMDRVPGLERKGTNAPCRGRSLGAGAHGAGTCSRTCGGVRRSARAARGHAAAGVGRPWSAGRRGRGDAPRRPRTSVRPSGGAAALAGLTHCSGRCHRSSPARSIVSVGILFRGPSGRTKVPALPSAPKRRPSQLVVCRRVGKPLNAVLGLKAVSDGRGDEPARQACAGEQAHQVIPPRRSCAVQPRDVASVCQCREKLGR